MLAGAAMCVDSLGLAALDGAMAAAVAAQRNAAMFDGAAGGLGPASAGAVTARSSRPCRPGR
jgi:hypothetical protein